MISKNLFLFAVDDVRVRGWQNVSDGNAISLAIAGMLIVFFALVFISLAIAALPRILAALDPFLPKFESPHHAAKPPAESLPADEEKVVAAIGRVLYAEMQRTLKR